MRKTLEGEEHLLKEAPLSLQTSLSLRELPHKTPTMTRAKICFAFLMVGVLWGSFWFGREVQTCCRVRLRTRLVSGM